VAETACHGFSQGRQKVAKVKSQEARSSKARRAKVRGPKG